MSSRFRFVAFIIASFTGTVMRRHGGRVSISILCRLRSRFGEARTVMGRLVRQAEVRTLRSHRARTFPLRIEPPSCRSIDTRRSNRPLAACLFGSSRRNVGEPCDANARHDLAAHSHRHADLYRIAALVQLWRETRTMPSKISAATAAGLLLAARLFPEAWFNKLFFWLLIKTRARRIDRGELQAGEVRADGAASRRDSL
jgi:hypothetical protein